jgi:hypothetical protein
MHASVIERFGKASSPSSSNQRRGRSVDKPAVAVATGPSVVFKFRADQTVVAYPAERFEVGQLFAEEQRAQNGNAWSSVAAGQRFRVTI